MSLYGYVDDEDKSLKSKGGSAKFGLNPNIRMTKFVFEPNAGADDSPGEAIDIEFMLKSTDDRAQRMRIFPFSKVYAKKGGEIEEGHEEYESQKAVAVKQYNAQIIHILHRFADKETVKASLTAADVVDFKSFANACVRVLPPNYAEVPLDIFMQWQWNITGDNKQTFIGLPKNLKQGPWLTLHEPGNFVPSEDPAIGKALVYVDPDTGTQHSFARNANYMENNFANQQFEGGDDRKDTVDMGSAKSGTAGATGTPKKAGW